MSTTLYLNRNLGDRLKRSTKVEVIYRIAAILARDAVGTPLACDEAVVCRLVGDPSDLVVLDPEYLTVRRPAEDDGSRLCQAARALRIEAEHAATTVPDPDDDDEANVEAENFAESHGAFAPDEDDREAAAYQAGETLASEIAASNALEFTGIQAEAIHEARSASGPGSMKIVEDDGRRMSSWPDSRWARRKCGRGPRPA